MYYKFIREEFSKLPVSCLKKTPILSSLLSEHYDYVQAPTLTFKILFTTLKIKTETNISVTMSCYNNKRLICLHGFSVGVKD